MINNNKRLLSIKEAAAHPDIPWSESKLRKKVMRRDIPCYKENPEVRTSSVYVTIEDILTHIHKCRISSNSEIASQSKIAV